MTIYGVEASGSNLDVLKWPGKKEAQQAGNNWLLVETEKELAESSVSTKFLADLWNLHNPTENLARFTDRELGATKVFAMFPKIAITPKQMASRTDDQTSGDDEVAKASTAKKAAPAKAAKTGNGAKGKGNVANLVAKKSEYDGKKLYPSDAIKKSGEAPHRAGSHGFNSIKIIMDNPGILYNDFIKKSGSHIGYLRQQIKNGHVNAKA